MAPPAIFEDACVVEGYPYPANVPETITTDLKAMQDADVKLPHGHPHLEPSVIFACTYTDISVLAHTPEGEHGQGIYSLKFDPQTGMFERLGVSPVGPNPAFLIQHPKHKNLVYGTTEQIAGDGEIISFRVGAGGALTEVGRQSAAGRSTCYVNIHKDLGHLVAVNYWDAKVNTFPLSEAGEVGAPTDINMQPGAQYVLDNNPCRTEHWQYRQRWPHSHCCVTEPYDRRLTFVTDLGQDAVFVYETDTTQGRLVEKGRVQLEKGRGPRHLVFHPTLHAAYISNELDSTVTALRVNPREYGAEPVVQDVHDKGAVLEHMQCVSSLPEDWQGTGKVHDNGVWKAASHSAELRIHPSGKWLYVANRGHDSIAVYDIGREDGSLSLVEIVPSGGKCPRNFNFDVSGAWMIVGNQNSNNLTSFRINEETGALTQAHQVPMPLPNYVFALPASVCV